MDALDWIVLSFVAALMLSIAAVPLVLTCP